MSVKPQIKKLQAYVPGKSVEAIKKEYGLEKVIKLASNENPFGTSKKVKEAVIASEDFARYPDGATAKLKEKIAEHLQVLPENLLFGSGADEVIQTISRSILVPGDNIVQGAPTFSQYEHHAVIEGAEVRSVPLKNGVHNLEKMAEVIDGKTKIVWVCNPNNPTGTYVNEEELLAFLQKVPSSVLVVVDEAYVEYATAKDFPKTLALQKDYENLIVLRTFSKVYGLAAFRVGYAVGPKELMKELDIVRLPFNTSTIGQTVAIIALEDQNFVAECVRKNESSLKQYTAFFEENHIPYYPSQGNFIFLPLENSKEIAKKLEVQGYIIRAFPTGIRITIGTEEENEGLIACLRDTVIVSSMLREE